MIDTFDPGAVANFCAIVLIAFGMIDALVWLALWRSNAPWPGYDSATHRHRFFQGLVIAVIGVAVYASLYYCGRAP